jgi:hypothetical protein
MTVRSLLDVPQRSDYCLDRRECVDGFFGRIHRIGSLGRHTVHALTVIATPWPPP